VAVDFEGFEGFVAAGVAGGLEDGSGAIFKAGEEGAGVIDGDGVDFSGFLVDAFFDEGLSHGGDGDDVAIEPAGAVDVVSEEVASDAGSGCGGVEAPEGFAALGEFLRHGPVLEEVGAVVVDAAEVTASDDLLGESDGGEKAVVIPALLAVEGEGFFAEDHFAIFDGGHGDVVVRIVWGADVDGVDVVAFYEFTPVGFGVSIAPFLGEFFNLVFGASADDLFDRDVSGVEEVLELGVGVGMGATHEAVANDADADRFFGHQGEVMSEGDGGKSEGCSSL